MRKRLQRPRLTRKPRGRVDWVTIAKGCITDSKIASVGRSTVAGIPSNVGRIDTIRSIR